MARTVVVPVRLSIEERVKLYEAARPFRMSLSGFIRHNALKRRMPTASVGEVNVDTYRELCRVGNNLNQLTRAVNEGRVAGLDVEILHELRGVVKEIGMQAMGVWDDREAE